MCDGEEKKLLFAKLRRKRRHQKRPKMVKNLHKNGQNLHTQSKKKKKKKKRAELFLFCSSAQQTHKEREKAAQREKKDAREHNQRQTNDDERTATHRGGEVREGVERAESGRVREGALLFFLLLRNSSS